MTKLAYLNDPLRLEFTAKIIHKTKTDDGHVDVILEETYFYPTGGGQSRDTGMLGEARVIDVIKADDGTVIHRLDGDISGEAVPAKIDYERRLGNMQHHSAQHIVSAAFTELLDLETVSAHISSHTPSTIDLPMAEISQIDLERIEQFANGLIFENRSIKTYSITDEQVPSIPFRRPPKVKGQIRVVEIDSFDYSACGGTHCPQTGMIGLIKILKTEKRNQKLRIHFVAGMQLLRYLQNIHQIVSEVSRHLSSAPEDTPGLVAQQSDQLRQAQKEVKQLKLDLLAYETARLIAQADPVGSNKLVLATFDHRPAGELRELGSLLQQEAGIIAVLAGVEGQRLSLVVSCADDTGISARELLAKQLAQIDGKGGGDHRLAQGGGSITAGILSTFFDETKNYIQTH